MQWNPSGYQASHGAVGLDDIGPDRGRLLAERQRQGPILIVERRRRMPEPCRLQPKIKPSLPTMRK